MRKWWPLVAVCLGAFMLLVDVTIVAVALPAMGDSLRASFSGLQWVIDAYALALAATLLGAGSLADLMGRRRVYVAGLALFAAASLACGLAPNAEALVAARVVQGVAGAAMFATTMALLSAAYQGRDRSIAFGVWGAVNGAAASAGPILGGLLTQHLGWRTIFLINLPVSVIAVALTRRVIVESRNREARGVDVSGTAAFTVAAATLTYALIRSREHGWTSAPTLALAAVAVAALAAFVSIERHSDHPMLDLGLFRRPAFVAIMAAAVALSASAFAYGMYVSLWLQTVLGLSAVGAGLVLLPLSAVALVVAPLAGRLLYGSTPRLVIGAGLAVIGVGGLMQAVLDADSTWAAILPGLAVTGVGVGIVSPSLASAGMSAVPPERSGMAGGAMNAFRQLGMALGIAVLGSVLQGRMTGALSGHVPDAEPVADALAAGRADAVLAHGHAGIEHLLRGAFASGLNAMYVAAGLVDLLVGLALCLPILHPRDHVKLQHDHDRQQG